MQSAANIDHLARIFAAEDSPSCLYVEHVIDAIQSQQILDKHYQKVNTPWHEYHDEFVKTALLARVAKNHQDMRLPDF